MIYFEPPHSARVAKVYENKYTSVIAPPNRRNRNRNYLTYIAFVIGGAVLLARLLKQKK